MPVIRIEELTFIESADGTASSSITYFHPCEAKVVRFPKGYRIGKHLHSGDVLQVILRGEIGVEDHKGEREVGTDGMFHKCAPFPYSAEVLKESFVLMVQTPGTAIIEHSGIN